MSKIPVRYRAFAYLAAGLVGYPLAILISPAVPFIAAAFGLVAGLFAGFWAGVCIAWDLFADHLPKIPWRLRLLLAAARHDRVFQICIREGCERLTCRKVSCDECLAADEGREF